MDQAVGSGNSGPGETSYVLMRNDDGGVSGGSWFWNSAKTYGNSNFWNPQPNMPDGYSAGFESGFALAANGRGYLVLPYRMMNAMTNKDGNPFFHNMDVGLRKGGSAGKAFEDSVKTAHLNYR